ncbi:MAG: DsbA family protein [Myxococcales bacterium]|jgi:predicted DsbA family dithiol-disulfide isomerase|nr:DsbA family protein [Myxococcales bacterium]
MSTAAGKKIEFGYWSDPLCVWALVAQEKLDRVLADLGEHLTVDYRVVPVFGSVAWRFTAGPWAAEGVEGRVAATRRIAEAAGRKDVSGECWRRAQPASSWAPAAAIKAAFAAERAREAEPGAGARFQRALRERFFVAEEDTARRDVALAVAESTRVPRASIERRLDDGTALAAVWEDHTERERLRIQGSPTYVFDGGRAMLYGNFDYGILRATVLELVRGLDPGSTAC